MATGKTDDKMTVVFMASYTSLWHRTLGEQWISEVHPPGYWGSAVC